MTAAAGAAPAAGTAAASSRPTTATAASASAPASAPAKAIVAILPLAVDFEEKAGTDEDYGQRVAFALAQKWGRAEGWEVVDRYTVADAMAQAKLRRGAEVDRRGLAELVRGALAADAVVFGSASGTGPAKTLRVCVIDYRDARGVWPGRCALDKTFKLAYWTDLRFVLEESVAAVTGHVFVHPSEDLAVLDPASVAAWGRNPNLVPNPAFAEGEGGRLARWEAVIEAHRYRPAASGQPRAAIQEDRQKMVLWSPPPAATRSTPVPGVSTTAVPAVEASTGKTPMPYTGETPVLRETAATRVLQFAMPQSVAGTNGLACYSDWIAVEPNKRYRCRITYASDGPTFLPFIKGYALIETPGEAQPQRREVYRRQFPKLKSTGGQWQTATVDFVPSVLPPKQGVPNRDESRLGTPGHREPYDLRWIRVDLYCYWPQGRLWVKDVAIKLVEPAGE